MQQKTLIIAIMSLFCTSLSYASFVFHLEPGNTCEKLPGKWVGDAKASNWLLGECRYHGTGEASALDSQGRFVITASADKQSGNPVCPEHATESLNARCSNGVVTVTTDYGNLTGQFSETAGSAKGTLSVSPLLEAEVSIKFKRAE